MPNKSSYNPIDDVSSDEEDLKQAIIEEASKNKGKLVDRQEELNNRATLAAWRNEGKSSRSPPIRRLFNLKNLRKLEMTKQRKQNQVPNIPTRREFYEYINKARYDKM